MIDKIISFFYEIILLIWGFIILGINAMINAVLIMIIKWALMRFFPDLPSVLAFFIV